MKVALSMVGVTVLLIVLVFVSNYSEKPKSSKPVSSEMEPSQHPVGTKPAPSYKPVQDIDIKEQIRNLFIRTLNKKIKQGKIRESSRQELIDFLEIRIAQCNNNKDCLIDLHQSILGAYRK